jgi:hypothetical protein
MSLQDLHRILRAYCSRPDAGSRYIECGDYSIVSTDGAIIPHLRFHGELKAGIEFDMSIKGRVAKKGSPVGLNMHKTLLADLVRVQISVSRSCTSTKEVGLMVAVTI